MWETFFAQSLMVHSKSYTFELFWNVSYEIWRKQHYVECLYNQIERHLWIEFCFDKLSRVLVSTYLNLDNSICCYLSYYNNYKYWACLKKKNNRQGNNYVSFQVKNISIGMITMTFPRLLLNILFKFLILYL